MSTNESRPQQQLDEDDDDDSFRSVLLLELFLGLYKSGIHGFRYFTMAEFANLAVVSRHLRERLRFLDYTQCRDGRDYRLPYPAIPGVLLLSGGGGLFAHQLASLRAMYEMEHAHLHFGALRGGILGDAPGLGKTITLLALVASTAGLRPVTPPEFWNATSIQEGWKHLRINPAARKDILEAFRPLRKYVQHQYHYPGNSVPKQILDRVMKYVEPPYHDDRFPTIQDFERYVKRQLKHVIPQSQLEVFRSQMVDIKTGLDKANRKLLKSEQGRRLGWERRLLPTSATLIIVPDALLEHWFQQIHWHLQLSIFEPGGRGVIFVDGIGDMAKVVSDHTASLRNVSLSHTVEPAWSLSQYLIVITTFSRCEAQYQREVAAGHLPGLSKKRSREDAVRANHSGGGMSPFLQLRWLRLVVDEGHELGTHPAGTNATRFIHQIAAERRWVLSGTPMTGDEDDRNFTANALDQLQRLLFFLRHPVYGQDTKFHSKKRKAMDEVEESRKEKARDRWNTCVKQPFLKRMESGREELFRVLREIMVMHRKDDIDLPKPIFRQIERNIQISEEVEERIMKLSGLSLLKSFDEYLHSQEFQTLVDQNQAEYIIEATEKTRKDRVKGVDLRPVKAVVYSHEKNNLLSVAESVIRHIGLNHIAEMYESPDIGDMSSELSRFRLGVRECRKCPVCHSENDVKRSRRADSCKNTLIEVVLVSSPHVRFLIEPQRIRCALNIPIERMQGDAVSNYNKHSKFWCVNDELIVDIRDPHPFLCKRESEDTWRTYGSDSCIKLAERDHFQGNDWYFGPLPPAESTDDFEVVVRLVKWQTCGAFHKESRWYQGPKFRDQPVEQISEDVYILFLDAALSHGLDLSFVTHIFLLEPIDDAALLEQVTSRANRLGATGPVEVETINTFYKISDKMKESLYGNKDVSIFSKKDFVLYQDRTAIRKAVCEHCFRTFASIKAAEEHEITNCPRNPENVHIVDRFHLSSVFREIKPPPALRTEAQR
jgi:hypothetical protein